jgi:phenylalanyl-tRNA synthetase beta chain
MVVVEYLYEEMKGLVNLPLEKVVNGLSELGAPSEYEEETKKVITELTPNRPDWYSMEGLARALRAYYGKGHPEYSVEKSDYEVIVDASLAKIRPYTACAVVKGLKFNDQRITDMVLLQEKLLATLGRKVKKFGLGIYPLHVIKFPVRYTTMKPAEIRYVPLGHEKEMSAAEIMEQHKKGQQYGHLIRQFDRYPVFMDAAGKIMALIPVVNSAETGKVDVATKDVFIEVSGTDLHACKAALNILVCTFADMGGTIYEVGVKYGKETLALPDLEPKKVKLDLKKVNGILGLELKEKDAASLLARMGYKYEDGQAIVPPYRADIMGPIDVIEDIAIAYGYNNFKPTIPDFFFPGKISRDYEDADAAMRGMGFLEIKTFILTNREKLKRTGYEGKVVEISNPSNEEFTIIRPNLLSDMLDTFAINKMKGLPQRFYEIDIVQAASGGRKRLIFGIMDKKVDFSDARGCLQALAQGTGFEFTLEKKKGGLFEPAVSCVVVSKGKELGVFGKVDADVMEKFGLGFEAYLCELEL